MISIVARVKSRKFRFNNELNNLKIAWNEISSMLYRSNFIYKYEGAFHCDFDIFILCK
jgi:hypothetical protein